jgi:hypothetical protein
MFFWLHHSNIDRIYAEWQQALPELANDFDGKDEHGRVVSIENEVWLGSVKDLLPFGWDKKVLKIRDLMDINQWCYSYSPGMRRNGEGELIATPPPFVTRIQMGISSSSLESHHANNPGHTRYEKTHTGIDSFLIFR